MKASSYKLLGIRVNPLSISELNALIGEIVEAKERRIIASQNLHSIYVYHHNAKMRSFAAIADYMRVDGMPLVLFGRLLGYPMRRKHRVTYMDWLRPLMAEAAQQGWRVFYLGSKPGVAERGAFVLRQEFPGLQLVTAHGYFNAKSSDSPENLEVLETINAYQPHILMVGMGMPRQEHWILDNVNNVNANAVLTCGACIDYIAGAIPVPPRWMGRLGLEWFYRLFSEPTRLWKRYLVEPWFVFGLFLQDIRKPRAQRFEKGN